MTTVEEALSRPDAVAAKRGDGTVVRTLWPYRSWLVFVIGAVLAAVTAVAVVEVVSALAGSPLSLLPVGDRAPDYASGARWSDPTVRAASVLLALVGLVLISLALLPGRGHWLALRTDDPMLAAGLSRKALREVLAGAACELEGVRGARVTLGRRRARVRVDAERCVPEELPSAVRAVVEQRVAELALVQELKIRVSVRRGK